MRLNQFGLPDHLPEITVSPSGRKPFGVENREIRWWFARPVIGEATTWCCYDMPEWSHANEMMRLECVGKADVHGIECFELRSEMFTRSDGEWLEASVRRFFVNQTADYTRTIAVIEIESNKTVISSFYDEHFIDNWGKEQAVLIRDEGRLELKSNGEYVTAYDGLMVCDRCDLSIGQTVFDCVRVFDLDWFEDRSRSILMESFISKEGRTLLSRRYNATMWGVSENGPRKTPWHIAYPDSNRIIINGITFVHWYDSASCLAFRR